MPGGINALWTYEPPEGEHIYMNIYIFMYVCKYIYIYNIYIYIYIHYICKYMYIACPAGSTRWTYEPREGKFIHEHTCIYMYIYMYMYMHIIYICIFIACWAVSTHSGPMSRRRGSSFINIRR